MPHFHENVKESGGTLLNLRLKYVISSSEDIIVEVRRGLISVSRQGEQAQPLKNHSDGTISKSVTNPD